MSDKLKQLEIKKLLTEYDYFVIDEEIKTEVVNEYLPKFTEEINEFTNKIEGKKEEEKKEVKKGIDVNTGEPKEKEIKKVIEDDDLPKETKDRIKKLFREIVKKTHPDKTKSEDLIDIYIKSKEAYEANDILKLAYYANKVDIKVELSDMEIQLLNDLIIYKKDELSEIEKSWLWKWYKANTEAERDMIIKMFYLEKRKK
jgi:hypothetical protein